MAPEELRELLLPADLALPGEVRLLPFFLFLSLL